MRVVFRDWRDTGIRLKMRRHPGWYAISAVTYVSLMLLTIATGSALGVLRITNFELLPYLSGAAMAFVFFCTSSLTSAGYTTRGRALLI